MSEPAIVYEVSDTHHWKTLFPEKNMLLGSHNLNPGEELVAEIVSVNVSEILNQNGDKEQVPVATFTNAPPMVLNKTNCLVLEGLYGPVYDGWAGKSVQIYAAEVKAFGKHTLALRIQNKIPATGQDTSEHEAALKACKTMAELQEVYGSIPKHLKKPLSSLKDSMKGRVSV